MPFTFSHPAIVLPFFKIRHASVSMSALVIGSITPDFEYIIKMKASGRYGHSLEGIFLFDLPIACVIAVVFHLLIKTPAINSMPAYFHQRLIVLRDFDFLSHLKNYSLGFISCLLIGIASHILWDGFTHSDDYFVKKSSFLSSTISISGLGDSPIHVWLQHASSIIGAGFILLFFHRQPVKQQENAPSLKFWIVSLVVASVTFAIRASFTFEYFPDIGATIISAAIIGLIVSSIFIRISSTNDLG
jgi:hypothetical protein